MVVSFDGDGLNPFFLKGYLSVSLKLQGFKSFEYLLINCLDSKFCL